MYVIVTNEKRTVHAEKTDQCYRCEDNKNCPMIGLLATPLVTLNFESLKVTNCGHYKSRMRVVE